ncbi:MAG: AMP-binding protein, partial [Rhodospirillales bacterium]|nr:AMP-binding protein [Rhodospirillales bacterium]
MAADFSIAGLLAALAERASHPAIVAVKGTATTPLSYGEVAQLTAQLAAGLRTKGLAAGETVGLWGPNSADGIIVSLAIVAAGGVIVPIDDQAADAEALAFLRDSGATRTFAATTHLLAFTAENTHRDEALFRLDDVPPDGYAAAVPHWRSLLTTAADAAPLVPDRDPDRPLALFYTSGTTGTPKSFFLSERNVAANVDGIRATGAVRGDDRLLLPLPLHHAYPWIVGVLTSVAIGMTIVLPEGVSGPQLVTALRAADVTVLAGVPRLYAALTAGIAARANERGRLAAILFRALTGVSRMTAQKFDWNSGRVLLAPIRQQVGPRLRLLVSGGAKLDADVIWQLR